MVERTRYHLLDGSDANRLTVSLALNRYILAVLLGDQVDAVVADDRSETHLPACPLQACGDVAFEFHPVHGIDFLHAGVDPHSPRSRSRHQNGEKQATETPHQTPPDAVPEEAEKQPEVKREKYEGRLHVATSSRKSENPVGAKLSGGTLNMRR